MKMRKLTLLSLLVLTLSFRPEVQAQQTRTIEEAIAFYVDKVNADSIHSHIQALQDFGTRFCLADNHRDIAVWLKNKFISYGYSDTKLDSFAFNYNYGSTYYQTWQYNVIATYPGFVNPDKVYIMGAHYDAIVPSSSNPFVIAPGADDNASGVAAALEVARIMKKYGYVPESTIKFITFPAEEFGLYGSWDFADKAFSQGMNIEFMLNNDMISYCTLPPEQWKVDIIKYPNSPQVTNLARYIAENFTPLTVVETTQYMQQSDSWPFYSNGFKAVFLMEDQFTPYYHTVNDLLIHSNMAYTAEMVKISMGMLVHENGTGIIAGATCGDPLVVDLPLNYSGSTELYGNHYLPNWIVTNPTYLSNYIAGNDLVFSFTLESNSILSGDISCPAGNRAGVFILNACPDIFNPPTVIQFAGGNSGGSFSQLPLPAGDYYAIVANWPQPMHTNFTLNIDAVEAQQQPELIASPTNLNFGSVTIGNQSAVRTVKISNYGSQPLNINSLTLTGENYDQFTIHDQPALPFSIQFGETTDIGVVFNPTQPGLYSAFLTISGNIPDVVHIPINGSGMDSVMIYTPYAQDFTSVTPGQLPAGWYATMANWSVVNSNHAGGEAPELMFSGTSGVNGSYSLVMNPVNAQSNNMLILKFHSMLDYNSGNQNPFSLKLQSSFNGGMNWSDQWVLNPSSSLPAQQYSVDLGSLAGEKFLLAWVFEGEPNSINAWYIDNIILTGEENPVLAGDSNCDGIVNVIDVITTINYILNLNPTPFCFENADVTGDNLINILDVIGTVNIIIGGVKSDIADIESNEAYITLNSNSIDIVSDGTLAGIQFELIGKNLESTDFWLELSDYEFAYSVHKNKLTGIIYSFDNRPLPYGEVRLIRFGDQRHDINWGEVIAGNVKAEEVEVVKSSLNNLSFTSDDYKLMVYPNPAKSDFIIEVELPALSETHIQISDMYGRNVMVINDSYLSEGVHKFTISDKDKLRPGFYLLNIEARPSGIGSVITRNLKLVIQ